MTALPLEWGKMFHGCGVDYVLVADVLTGRYCIDTNTCRAWHEFFYDGWDDSGEFSAAAQEIEHAKALCQRHYDNVLADAVRVRLI